MRLDAIDIENFCSFGKTSLSKLSNRGLVLVDGENYFSESADNNGSGKSSLFEAFVWCLFGQTTKKQLADDIVSIYSTNGTLVRIAIEDPSTESRYEIARTRKHVSLGDSLTFKRIAKEAEEDLSGVDKDDTQKRINDFLGMNFTIFTNSCYLPQENIKPFCSFTDKEIKSVLMDALDLGAKYPKALEAVRVDMGVAKKELEKLDLQFAQIDREAEQTRELSESYVSRDKAFQVERSNRAAAVLSRITQKEAEAIEMQRRLSEIPAREEELKKIAQDLSGIPSLQAEVTRLSDERRKLEQAHAMLTQKAQSMTQQIKRLSTDNANIKAKIGTSCPSCGQEITEGCLKGYYDANLAQIEETRAQIAKFKPLFERSVQAVQNIAQEQEGRRTTLEALRRGELAMTRMKSEIEQLKQLSGRIEAIKKEIEGLWAEKTRIEAETSPFIEMHEKAVKKIQELKDRRKSLEDEQAQIADELAHLEYLETAFGYAGIPSFVLDSVTPSLNASANHHAAVVCDGEIEITFSTIQVNKKGTVKDKFGVGVKHLRGAAKYTGASGGEKKRADICVAQAIQDLVRDYGKNSLGIAFYDEPFESLDDAGVQGVFAMLKEIAGKIGTVLVVTHKPELKAFFSQTLTVRRDKDGISRIAE